jgi:hypothetical protein
VNAASDVIAEVIPPETAILAVCSAALEWFNGLQGGSEDFWLQREDRMKAELDRQMAMHPLDMPIVEPRLFVAGDQEDVRYSRVTGDELAV